MSGSEKDGFICEGGPDQRELVGGRGAKTSPGAFDRERRQCGQIFGGALEHARHDARLHFPTLSAALTRRTDEQWPVLSWLHVEGYRIRGGYVCTLQVPKLNHLVA